MNAGADVQAIDALEDWHTALCNFRTDANESLSSIAMEIRRAFDWIDDQAKGWYREGREAGTTIGLEVDRRWNDYFPSRNVAMGDSARGHLS